MIKPVFRINYFHRLRPSLGRWYILLRVLLDVAVGPKRGASLPLDIGMKWELIRPVVPQYWWSQQLAQGNNDTQTIQILLPMSWLMLSIFIHSFIHSQSTNM